MLSADLVTKIMLVCWCFLSLEKILGLHCLNVFPSSFVKHRPTPDRFRFQISRSVRYNVFQALIFTHIILSAVACEKYDKKEKGEVVPVVN
jgi:hypothetical protein